MTLRPSILDRLRSLGDVFPSRDALRAGVSWRDLYLARDAGLIVELSRGYYQLSQTTSLDQIDFIVACARAPKGMVCLGSALSYWDLSDEIPGWVDLAVPEGTHRPHIDHPPIQIHVFHADTFDLGRLEIQVASNARFVITDPERTVVDAFRLRHRLGEDLAIGGLKRYLQRSNPKPGRILELAGPLRVRTPMTEALRFLAA